MAETIISPGVLARENDVSFISPAPQEVGAAFIGPTVTGPIENPTIVTSFGEYSRKFGRTFISGSTNVEYLTSLAVKNYFDQGGNTALITRVVSGSAGWTAADSTPISGSTGKATTEIFTLQTIGKGIVYNNVTASDHYTSGDELSNGSLKSGSADNIRWEVSNLDTSKGTFSLLVRRGDDNHKNKIILETFNNLSLDPNDDRYIAKQIGDQRVTKATDGNNTYVTSVGEYPNRSNYIRVSDVKVQTSNYLGTDGIAVNLDSGGISYSASIPAAASGAFGGAAGTNTTNNAKFFKDINNDVAGIQGLIGGDYNDAITILENKDEWKFNIVSAPGLIHAFAANGATQTDNLISLAETRGDCIAVVDLVAHGTGAITTVTAEAAEVNSSYAATYWPWVQVGSATGKNVYVPASVVVPGVYAFTDGANAPWFAPAGLVRGGVPSVLQSERKLTRSERDTLYSGNVNPIATFPGQGIAIFGQKTLQKAASALDRVNVRRLLIELKKFVSDQANTLVFDQNTIATRNRFLSAVNPFLESVVQRQGLFSFRVVMDDSNNTADVIDRNQLIGQIFVQPAKTAEFIVLDFTLEPTGATFGG
tara:strand:- start:13868 stop:15646 length:1779 start_codon:yes stop_codon:yes gene_type:complete